MNPEKIQFTGAENYEKTIQIPKEELQAVQDIFSFTEKLSAEGYSDDSSYALSNSHFTVEELEEIKINELKQTLNSLSREEQHDLRRKIKRQAQYESYKGEIDFKNDQFEKLTQYIDSQKIWKHKFSTCHSFNLGWYDEMNFKGDGSESKLVDEVNSFAGQSRDSIYYVSKSGICLRLKRSLLIEDGIQKVLQKPQELILFFNRREQQKRDLNVKETFNDIENLNYDNEHPGHQVNKIYY